LSPRNAAVAANLASQFDQVSVAGSNQEVLDCSEIVVLAVRPQVAAEVLSGLRFSSNQTVISLVAGFPTRRIAELVTPAVNIWRAIPLPSVAQRRSPIALYPPGGPPAGLFALLGRVFEIEKEDQLNALSTATSTMAAYFAFAGHIASWVARKGIPEQQCRQYVAAMFAGLADAGRLSASSFEDLATAHATPGGLNEQVVRDLTDHGVFDTLTKALDSVHRRATGASA
jgi:pyrroline-5-carboxylate reductase